ncbi:Hypothetical protein NCS54_00747100 [Fusarium falciforme]|uniref:Hypothetical protein n=1 Tax=Fusarium falciforme TaxID=195108 RepID=UPI002300747F|nr:Hypothetical protein NCS54_00747100 [Fusarium falciforme]WAO90063.1 Hypothetical protein NCS54_00747100 [Fusarium falciforme]
MSSSETLDFVASVTVGRVSRAAISRVKTRSFNTVKLNSHPESLRQFDDVFSDETVRGSVKTFRYDVVLPVVSDKRLRNKFQSSREAAKNSRVFAEAIVALFTRLSCWEGQDVKLTLTATSPSDDPILRTGNLRVKQQRNLFKYISIETSVLPPVSCISFFDLQAFDCNTRHSSGRRLHPDAICVMVKALPCLEHTIWDLYMPPRRMPTLRKEFKVALAGALLQPLYNYLTTLTILLWDPDPQNEEAILVSDDEEDRLSLRMQRICELPTLVSLFLWGNWCISHRAFRRFGSSVRSVFVDMSMTTPDGGWLLDVYSGSEEEEEDDVEPDFDSDSDDQCDSLPDIDSENSDIEDRLPKRAEATANQDRPSKQIREVPNPKAFTPLVTSFAQAVANSNSSSCLGFAELRFSAALASMRLSYRGGAGGEDTRLGVLPDFAQRIVKADKVEMRRWQVNANGGIKTSGWKIPAVMWDAMEEVVGAENIDTNIDVDRIEGE